MKKIALLIIIGLFYNCLSAQKIFTTVFIPEKRRIDSLLKSIYKESLPGISVGILQKGETIFKKSYGISNINSKQKISSSSNFNICSLTKQFTAVAILQLEEKHLILLNDKLSKFFPDMNKKIADVVTIKQLLTHTSGIVDHYDYTNTNNMHHAHDSDVYNAIKNVDSTYFVPGTKFRYSNTAYCLLALIIEKLSGLTYNEYMQQNIFKAAGMNNTIIWNENAVIKKQVTGYDFDSSAMQFKKSGAEEHIFFSTEGDGGIYTSVDDYIRWFEALQSNKIFSKKIINEARNIEFMIDSSKKTGYGFGWFVDENDAQTKVYHSGDNGGFRTYSFTIPLFNYMIVIFSNRSDINIEAIVQQIIKLQWPAMLPFIKIEALTS